MGAFILLVPDISALNYSRDHMTYESRSFPDPVTTWPQNLQNMKIYSGLSENRMPIKMLVMLLYTCLYVIVELCAKTGYLPHG